MYNYRLCLQYDGARYDGWQRMGKDRDSSNNTIECKIVEIIKKMTGEDIEIFVGSRTEKGVHALGQVANFKLENHQNDYDIRNYLNRYLPRDIAVLSVEEVDERFHSQLNAKRKTYIYRLDIGDIADIFDRKYSYHTFEKPDMDKMKEAASLFVGSHDFKVFTTSKKSKSTVRNIYSIEMLTDDKNDNKVIIRIEADDFLHNMARYIIGVLLDVGGGLKKPEDVTKLLEGKSDAMSLPAEGFGLFLEKITY